MKYQCTKTYGHELGLSACFRQWRAKSHCRFLHGYALSFKFVFEADELDERNWVVDFGGLKWLKEQLQNTFDHKLLIAGDDPYIGELASMSGLRVADVLVLEEVGCEAFAKIGHKLAVRCLDREAFSPRCRVVSCEVSEHGANSAIYYGE